MKPTKTHRTSARTLHEVSEENIFTVASAGGVPLSAEDLAATEESTAVQESRRRLKEYAGGFTVGKVKRMPQYQQFLDFIATRNIPGIHPDDVQARWERMFGPMDVRMLRPIIDTLQVDGVLDTPSVYESKEKARMKKFPFTQTQLDENRVMRYFSKDLTDSELTWHRDRENRVVRMVEGKGWYLQLDGKLPKPIRLGESYRIPAGNWHRLIRRPDSSNLAVVVEKLTKGDQVKHKGKKATVKVPDARGPLVGIDPAGPVDMKMVPGDELEEPKKHEVAVIESVLDEALDDLLDDVLQEKKGKKDDHFSRPREYGAPEGSERDKMLDKTKADLASGDPEREKRAWARRDRMEKKEREKPGWENKPRSDTKTESYDAIDDDEIRALVREALSKKLKATLRKKAEDRGLTPGSVEAEYKKGLAAWGTSGSRKGMSQHQWAMARVNSANPSKDWAVVKKSKAKKK